MGFQDLPTKLKYILNFALALVLDLAQALDQSLTLAIQFHLLCTPLEARRAEALPR